jgi:hypothetical protein
LLQQLEPGSDLRKAWFSYLVMTANTQLQQQRLAALLPARDQQLAGLEIDQEKRWSIINRCRNCRKPSNNVICIHSQVISFPMSTLNRMY